MRRNTICPAHYTCIMGAKTSSHPTWACRELRATCRLSTSFDHRWCGVGGLESPTILAYTDPRGSKQQLSPHFLAIKTEALWDDHMRTTKDTCIDHLAGRGYLLRPSFRASPFLFHVPSTRAHLHGHKKPNIARLCCRPCKRPFSMVTPGLPHLCKRSCIPVFLSLRE